MLICRESELAVLNKLYQEDKFQFVVVYGRRRVGKTTLILEFFKEKPFIFFVADESVDSVSLEKFSKEVFSFFNLRGLTGFNSWEEQVNTYGVLGGTPQYLVTFDEKVDVYENIGKWWGNNPIKKIEEEIDIVAYDEKNILLSECKWQNTLLDMSVVKKLMDKEIYFILRVNFIYFSRKTVLRKKP